VGPRTLDAEAALTRLNAQATALADTEGLARLLLRAESVAWSRIEGLEAGARRASARQSAGRHPQFRTEQAFPTPPTILSIFRFRRLRPKRMRD
jgi:hypothetical protein